MTITVLEKEKIFKLDTSSCSYVMAVRGQNRLVNLYYGAPVDDAQLSHLIAQTGRASFWAIPADETDDFSTDVVPMEYSGSGSADLRPAAITTVDEDGGVTVESHLIDVNAQLYGSDCRVEFVRRLRGETKFESLAALQEQIARDVAAAKEILEK